MIGYENSIYSVVEMLVVSAFFLIVTASTAWLGHEFIRYLNEEGWNFGLEPHEGYNNGYDNRNDTELATSNITIKKGKNNIMYNDRSSDVFIEEFVKRDGKWVTEVTQHRSFTPNYKDYSWKWIKSVKKQGWVRDNPPPEPYVMASSAMLVEVDRILRADKQTKQAVRLHEIHTSAQKKQSLTVKSIEIARNQSKKQQKSLN